MISKSDKSCHMGIHLTYDFWKEFKYFELTESVRQKSDTQFSELLNRVRIGIPNKNDIELIEKRNMKIN